MSINWPDLWFGPINLWAMPYWRMAMADEADRAEMDIERELDASVQQVRNKAAAIPIGRPGECSQCGTYSHRLVNGVCAPCRDRLSLP